MIAYNRQWLDALRVRESVRDYMEKGLIEPDAALAIRDAYTPEFYTPNWFVRIGLAIFGWIAISALGGLFGILLSPDSAIALAIFLAIGGAGLFWFVERVLIGYRKHYRSGLDDVFVYTGVGCAIWSFALPVEDAAQEYYFLVAGIFSGIAAIRYADTPLTLFSGACFTMTVFSLVSRAAGDQMILLVPFMIMICAAGWYFLSLFLQKKHALRYWETPLQWIEAAALLMFYAGGNMWCLYYIGAELVGTENIQTKPFFWIFTIAVPPIYIALGLYRKDRLLLDMGIFCIAAMLGTIRFFHQVMPIEWALTLIGAICVALSWTTIRYLRNHAKTFTYAPDGGPTGVQQLQHFGVGKM